MNRDYYVEKTREAIDKMEDAIWEVEEYFLKLREYAENDIAIFSLTDASEKARKEKEHLSKKLRKILNRIFPVYYEETMDDGSIKRFKFK